MRPDFEVATWNHIMNDEGWRLYRVGTCNGQWRCTDSAYEILSFINDQPGNGDFGHTMDWFYESCKRDGRNLIVRELWNERLAEHLFKRGFELLHKDDMIKYFV